MEKKDTLAILVDAATFMLSPHLKDYLNDKSRHASLILLDDTNTYDWQDGDPDWAVIIRNHQRTDPMAFKTSALCAIQDSSNLLPAVAIDDSTEAQAMFEEGGVLVAFGSQ